MAKLKILFLHTFPLWGCGSGTYVRHLARELAKGESKVGVVCPDNRQIKGVDLFEVKLPFFVAFTGHPEHKKCKLYHQLSNQEIAIIYRSFFDKTIEAVEKFKPDIIHVQHFSIFSWVANFIQSTYKINYIITSHGTGLYTASLDKRYIPLTHDAARKAKKITAVSGDTKSWITKVFGEKHLEKIRVIPGGIDIKNFPPKKEIKIINKKYHLNGKKVVLFSGKLTPLKGVQYLVKAAAKIKGDVYILGDGCELNNLKKMASNLKLKNIHFLGYLGNEESQELEEFYYRADVFVAPSVWDEPLGLVILEAMICNTPVVVTRRGGIPLAVKDGYNGFFVRSRNSNQIAQMVNKLLEDDKLRNKLGANARKTVEEKFDWKKIAEKFLRIYKKYAISGNGKNGNKKKRQTR